MMRCVTAVTFALSASVASAGEASLEPLIEVMQGSNAGYPYVRCAGLFAAGLEFAQSREGDGTDTTRDMFTEEIGFHIALAHFERGLNMTTLQDGLDEHIQDDVSALQNQYAILMSQNYTSSGNPLAGMIQQDLEVCRALKKAIVSRSGQQ